MLWLRRFRWGPLEYVWRVATYGQLPQKQLASSTGWSPGARNQPRAGGCRVDRQRPGSPVRGL